MQKQETLTRQKKRVDEFISNSPYSQEIAVQHDRGIIKKNTVTDVNKRQDSKSIDGLPMSNRRQKTKIGKLKYDPEAERQEQYRKEVAAIVEECHNKFTSESAKAKKKARRVDSMGS